MKGEELRKHLEEKYKELTHSLPYAYAMGHSCSNADHPYYKRLRMEADDLLCRIQELK